MRHDYYSLLAGAVMASARDDAPKRRVIYELARSELRQELRRRSRVLAASTQAQELRALEAAIEQIEVELAQAIPVATQSTSTSVTAVIPSSLEILPPERHLSSPAQRAYEASPERAVRYSRRSWIRPGLSLLGAAILGGIAYLLVEHGISEKNTSLMTAARDDSGNSQQPPIRSITTTLPIPSSFGVFAVTDGRLIELSPLPIKVPERKVSILPAFASPSSTTLPNGHSQFIVFRRDMVNNAPERVVVRVVSQVVRVMHNGDSSTVEEEHAWIIRDTSYEMKVAPIDGNRAMFLIRPAVVDFSFPAGRYALLLKSVAYDFSVDGPATEITRCVESDDGRDSAAVYPPCRN
jgi:hypothetical protein